MVKSWDHNLHFMIYYVAFNVEECEIYRYGSGRLVQLCHTIWDMKYEYNFNH